MLDLIDNQDIALIASGNSVISNLKEIEGKVIISINYPLSLLDPKLKSYAHSFCDVDTLEFAKRYKWDDTKLITRKTIYNNYDLSGLKIYYVIDEASLIGFYSFLWLFQLLLINYPKNNIYIYGLDFDFNENENPRWYDKFIENPRPKERYRLQLTDKANSFKHQFLDYWLPKKKNYNNIVFRGKYT